MSGERAGIDPAIVEMDGLPRQNGELVFEAPWQARAFGVAVALCREQGLEWDAFRSRLVDEIGAWEREPIGEWSYYERWAASLERLVLELGLVEERELATRAAQLAHVDSHDHDHDHDHDH